MSELRKANTDLPYFITLTVVDWIDIFTRQVYCDKIIESLNFCIKNKGLIVFEYVIMPSHIHMIVQSLDGNLNFILRDFKSFTAKQIIKEIEENHQYESRSKWLLHMFEFNAKYYRQNSKYMFWQKTNYPIELNSAHIQYQKTEYIRNNPVEAGLVTDGEFWQYSSANPNSPLRTSGM
ncbi:transposase [uncultured Roseivirga sp.]|uniref:REP-associated tyrosine transposase n=1 Tax=uncultured Roseivirga sp. TaxID=543088 RepID=UPI0030DDCBC7|tara:strand:- start:196 stop:729 length:534 start_codon:yes stop_codon:yes gene_type:complete